MSTGAQIAPLLATGRQTVDLVFARIVELATLGEIPCVTVAAYNTIKDRQAQAEQVIVLEAKARGLHPPESVPRSFAMMGACAPGLVNTTVTKEAIQSGLGYVKGAIQRRRAQIKTLADTYQKDGAFKSLADQLLSKLGGANNVALLLPYFAVGGDLWKLTDAASFMNLEITSVTDTILQAVNAEADKARVALDEILANRRPAEKKGRWWVWPTVVLGAVGAGTGIWYLVKRMRRGPSMSYSGTEEIYSAPPRRQIEDSSIIDAQFEEINP